MFGINRPTIPHFQKKIQKIFKRPHCTERPKRLADVSLAAAVYPLRTPAERRAGPSIQLYLCARAQTLDAERSRSRPSRGTARWTGDEDEGRSVRERRVKRCLTLKRLTFLVLSTVSGSLRRYIWKRSGYAIFTKFPVYVRK